MRVHSSEMRRATIRHHLSRRLPATSLILLLLSLSACAPIMGYVSYYDPTTYKNLTDLKPQVMALYDTFTRDPVDFDKIAAIRLKLAQMYEYENGKGPKNIEVAKQIKKVEDTFNRDVDDRTSGKWTQPRLENAKRNIGGAFDVAIQMERAKNKNE